MTGQSMVRSNGSSPKIVLTVQFGQFPDHETGVVPLVSRKNSANSPLVIGRLEARKGCTISFRLGFSLSHPNEIEDKIESSSLSSNPIHISPPGKYCHRELSSIAGLIPCVESSVQSGDGI